MAWVMLIIAGLLEVVWATAMAFTNGWTRLWPSVITLGGMLASFYLLARSMRSIPPATAYAVWVGIGAIGVALLSPVVLKQPLNLKQWACVVLVAIGVVGLKLAATPAAGAGAQASPAPTP